MTTVEKTRSWYRGEADAPATKGRDGGEKRLQRGCIHGGQWSRESIGRGDARRRIDNDPMEFPRNLYIQGDRGWVEGVETEEGKKRENGAAAVRGFALENANFSR